MSGLIEFKRRVFNRSNRTGERIGQAAMNELHELDAELAQDVCGTDLDPFYDNTRLAAFMSFVGSRICK